MAEANQILIKNLENQLDRLVEQLKDLEECRNEISQEEFDMMRQEAAEQIKEFSETLDRMNKGGTTLNNKLSNMKTAIRNAISSSFNTEEMIKMFGTHSCSELEVRLQQMEEDFRLKKLDKGIYERQKCEILLQLKKQGRKLSQNEDDFLLKIKDNDMDQLEQVVE